MRYFSIFTPKMTQLISGDAAGFIRIIHPFSQSKFVSRLHSVSKQANPVTFIANINDYHIFGYENGNIGIYTLKNLNFEQQYHFETKQNQLQEQIPIHHDYFDSLNSKTQFSIQSATIVKDILYVSTILSEILLFDLKTSNFVSKFQLSNKYRKFTTIKFINKFIIHAGYQTIPEVFDLNGVKICELQKPEIEYLTGLEKKFELTQIQSKDNMIFCTDARGYVYRYNIDHVQEKKFVTQRQHIIDENNVYENSLQLLSFFRFEDFKITALCPEISVKELNDQQIKQRNNLLDRKVCAKTDILGPKRSTNPVEKFVKQMIFDDCRIEYQLLIGTGNGAIAIVDGITGMVISRNGRRSMSSITFISLIKSGILVCGRDKFIRILDTNMKVVSATYVVHDVIGSYEYGQGQIEENEAPEEEFAETEEICEDNEVIQANEVMNGQDDNQEDGINVDLGFFDDL